MHCNTNKLQNIKTNAPIPRSGKFYFEVLILNSGEKDEIGVGVCCKNYPVNRQPGWNPLSIGYHGDDGGIFIESGQKIFSTNELFTAGNVIGVLLDYSTQTLTFSKDKEMVTRVQLPPHFKNEDLYPCVGMDHAEGGIVYLVTVPQGMWSNEFINYFNIFKMLDII